ncbi:arachidonate 5-lipoxygenase-like [Pecten maximus]|uniref:arachidonate 5-lipoxygenase-like n=1 Tax=Pecten maximus TaxID=6579 RepID=UPI001458544C|nr:arachidonate 5-lipoxygenase-like [Pecten maximus]
MFVIGCFIGRYFTPTWHKLADLLNVYGRIFPKPSTADIWRDDAFFGRQRLVGVNPFVIERCTEIPKKMKDNIDSRRASLERVLQQTSNVEDYTLDTAIRDNRLFIVNYKILDGMYDQFGVCAPIALFLVDSNNELMPVAIQLQQDGRNNPMFLPGDRSWLMAKLWFNHADSSFQESFSHLGVTHLLMESVAVVTHRNLIQTHPIFQVLAPHFHYLLAINTEAREYLISNNGLVDQTLSIGRNGMMEIIRRRLADWRMDTGGILPADLENRGVTGDGILPNYYYRDDALLVYGAINDYVTAYVGLHYNDDGNNGLPQVIDDPQIQAWVSAIISERQIEGGGCGIQGLPLNDNLHIATNEQLIQILTCIIYMCSVSHAVTNFPQYEQYGFQPAYPVGMRGAPPQDPNAALNSGDIIRAIPSKFTCLLEMVIMKFLSTRNTNLLGDFDNFTFPGDRTVQNQFKQDLQGVVGLVDQRNRGRIYPYLWASPEKIPNAISI